MRKSSSEKSEKIAVIGAGYVGLTTSACLAYLGHSVVCADIDRSKIALLKGGRISIHEPGLATKVGDGVASGRLTFTTRSAEAAASADLVFLCLPTPSQADGSADISYVSSATAGISSVLQPGAVVISKSTVPPGTSGVLKRTLDRSDVSVAHNPEFLREGSAVNDFLNPDRVVIGAEDRSVADRIAALYSGVHTKILITDTTTAETTKYIANTFLATKLSFANSAAAFCEVVGADIKDTMTALGHDRRISADFLKPGPGWGGSCLPKDAKALIVAAETAGYDFSLLRTVLKVNEQQFDRIVTKVANRVVLKNARIALLGLAFKSGTDDVRSSPALEIARRLTAAGACVHAYDPAVNAEAVPQIVGLVIESDCYTAFDGASAFVVATEWEEFCYLDISKVAELMIERHIIDARNLLDHGAWVKHGFSYTGVGVKEL